MDDETTNPQQNDLPTDLTALDEEALAQHLDAARTEAQELQAIDPAAITEEQVARLETLADFAESVAEVQAQRAAEAQERAERAQRAAERLGGPGEGDGEPADGEGEGDGAEGEGEDAAEQGAEAVAAAAVTRLIDRIGEVIGSRQAPAVVIPRQPRNPQPAGAGADTGIFSITAAADVSGFSAGQDLNGMSEVARAFQARSRSFPQGPARQKHVRMQHEVASIRRDYSRTADGLFIGEGSDYRTMQEAMEAASKESRLSGGSLAASGGWCAPSETLYGLTQDETLDGIIDLPTIGVPRGGINYTLGPDFSDIYTDAGFHQTEAEAIAGTTKNCVEIDCPDFDEVRLDAVGICVKAPLLTRTAYPELVERWLSGTTVANEHKVAGRLLTAMATALGSAVAPTLTGVPTTWATLTMLELVAEGQRQAYRLSDNETMEVILPRWVRIAIRQDLANRSQVGAESITNAMIDQHFRDRNLNVQWVLNWGELSSPKTVSAFPSTFQAQMYPAGTFVRGNQDVINLSTVYDTGELQTNVYTAAFVEDGVLLAKMKHPGKLLTLPVRITGQMGANDLNDTFGAQS